MEELGGQVAAHSVRHTLPAQPTPLIGRVQELDAAKTKLLQAEVRLLTLTGPGGTGKTRLALAVAGELMDEFGDGVAFVDLSALHEPTLVVSTILQALDVPELGGGTPLEVLTRALHSRHKLLVLDNFEQLLPAAPLLAELLATCPKLKLLLTSRAALKLRWEHLFPVPPLAVPDPTRLPDLETLREVSAVTLFLKRTRAVQPDFALTPENAPAVAGICRRLDGLPLALELAAPRLKLFGPSELLGRLEQRLDLLSAHASDLPTRQRTLHAEIDWSYGLLSGAEKALFRRLGVFVGGFSAEAALEVCGDIGVDALEGLSALVDQSLVRVEQVSGETRYRMLETIRAFALDRLEGHPQEKLQTEERHGHYYLNFLQNQGRVLGRLKQREALGSLDEDVGNVRQAWGWAIHTAQVEEVSRSAAALCTFHDVSGRYWEGIAGFEAALGEFKDAEHPDAIGHILAAQAWLYKGLGDYEHAAELAERSLQLLRPLGAGWGIVTVLSGLAFVLSAKGDHSGAKERWEEALALAQTQQDDLTTANLTAHLGMAEVWLGNYGEAQRCSRRALDLARRTGDRVTEVFALLNLGNAETYGGHLLEGRVAYQEGVRIARELGYGRTVPLLLYCLGWFALKLENFAEARVWCEEAVALAREAGNAHMECFALMNLGSALSAVGNLSGAEDALMQSLRAARQTQSTALMAGTLVPLGEVRLRQGRQEEATELLSLASRHPASGAFHKERAVQLLNSAQLLPEALGRAFKPGEPDRLEEVVAALLEGEPQTRPPVSRDPAGRLTERETQVLKLVAEGLTNKRIAARLEISEKTVTRHLENIFNKLDVSSRMAATAFAVREGIVRDRRIDETG